MLNYLATNQVTRICLWVGLLGVILMQGWAFTGGYRMTGDDIHFQNVLLEGVQSALANTHHIATGQGRIGQYVSVPLVILGSYWVDILWVRWLFVGLYFLLFYMVALLVARLIRSEIVLYLLAIYVSLSNLGPAQWNHLPPVAYPILITVPLLIIVGAKLWRTTWPASDAARWRKVAYATLMLFAMLINEFAFLFGSGLLLVELAAEVIRQRKLDWRPYLLDLSMMGLSLGIYIAFRRQFPSDYAGNIPDGVFNLTAMLKTLVGHVLSGSTLTQWFGDAPPMLPLAGKKQLLVAAVYGGLSGAVFFILSKRVSLNPKAWLVTLAAGLFAMYASIPTAITQKYQDWCLQGVCTYIDSRLSYFGLVICFGLFWLLLIHVLAGKPLLARMVRLVGACLLAGMAAHTFLHNEIVRSRMVDYAHAWERAQHLACAAADLSPGQPDLVKQIDPEGLVVYHPGFPAETYWANYMRYIKTERGCPAGAP